MLQNLTASRHRKTLKKGLICNVNYTLNMLFDNKKFNSSIRSSITFLQLLTIIISERTEERPRWVSPRETSLVLNWELVSKETCVEVFLGSLAGFFAFREAIFTMSI